MKGRRLDRQQWINGTARTCDHTILDVLKNYAEEPLAEVCAACGVRIAEYGKCDGCGKGGRLSKFDGPRRFHDGVCLTKWNEAQKAKKRTESKQPSRTRGEGGWR